MRRCFSPLKELDILRPIKNTPKPTCASVMDITPAGGLKLFDFQDNNKPFVLFNLADIRLRSIKPVIGAGNVETVASCRQWLIWNSNS